MISQQIISLVLCNGICYFRVFVCIVYFYSSRNLISSQRWLCALCCKSRVQLSRCQIVVTQRFVHIVLLTKSSVLCVSGCVISHGGLWLSKSSGHLYWFLIWTYCLFYFGGLGLLFCLTKLRVTQVVFWVISVGCCNIILL